MISLRERQRRVRERGEQKRATLHVSPEQLAWAERRMINHGRRGGKMLEQKHRNLCSWFWYLLLRIPARWVAYNVNERPRRALTVFSMSVTFAFAIYFYVRIRSDGLTTLLQDILWLAWGTVLAMLMIIGAGVGLYVFMIVGIRWTSWVRSHMQWFFRNPSDGSYFRFPDNWDMELKEMQAETGWLRTLMFVIGLLTMPIVAAVSVCYVVLLLLLHLFVLLRWLVEEVVVPAVRWFFTKHLGRTAFTPALVTSLGITSVLWVSVFMITGFEPVRDSLKALALFTITVLLMTIQFVILLRMAFPKRVEQLGELVEHRVLKTSGGVSRLGRFTAGAAGFFGLAFTFLRAKKWGVCPRIEFSDDVMEAFKANSS